MKTLLFGCALLASSVSAAPLPVAQVTDAPKTTTKVAVFFTRKTTFAQLAAIKQDVLKDGLGLEYDRLEFDKDGHLLKISFHVDCEGYTWGSATENNLTDSFSFGFVRDFTPGAKTAFQIGNFK